MNGYCDNEESYNNYYASLTSEYKVVAEQEYNKANIAVNKESCKALARITAPFDKPRKKVVYVSVWDNAKNECTVYASRLTCDINRTDSHCENAKFKTTCGGANNDKDWDCWKRDETLISDDTDKSNWGVSDEIPEEYFPLGKENPPLFFEIN